MSHYGALDTPAGPTLPPFPTQAERRRSPRMPLGAPVKVGAPHGPAQAAVSATDLSAHGLFIDADRPVRVGARFSLEIPLPDGSRVYVPEAEVAYNRARPHGSGFGVRFLSADPGALVQIAQAVEPELVEPETLDGPSMPIAAFGSVAPSAQRKVDEPTTEIRSDLPTLAPGSIDLSQYPEPEILAEALAQPSMISVAPEPMEEAEDEPLTDRIFAALAAARGRFAERARAFPRLWTGVFAGGIATIAAAVVLTLYTGSDAQAVKASGAGEHGVSATTHQALMGGASLAEVPVVEARPAEVEAPAVAPKKPLPPLVVIDEPAEVQAVEVADAAAAAPKPEVEVEADPVVAAPQPSAPKAQASAPAPAPAAEVKKVVAAKQEVKPAPAKEPSARAQQILGGGAGTLTLSVDPGAKVLRTHALKGPDRFVIDLVGQNSNLNLPAPVGRVKTLRAGKHPEYTRVVVDTTRPIKSGAAKKDGNRLVLTLQFD